MLSARTRAVSLSVRVHCHSFASTALSLSHRALVYSDTGAPTTVLRALTYSSLPEPAPGTLNLRVLLSPINPADINVLQGVYPTKPIVSALPGHSGGFFVAGNEGVAEISAVGPSIDNDGLTVGDWVVIAKPQSGLWSSARNVHVRDVIKIPRKQGFSAVHAATMTVNPPTAYNMLNGFVDLRQGEWIVQNAANSAVGQAVIQIAKARGLNTLNLIRDRAKDEAEQTRSELVALGADLIWTYSELADKSKVAELKTVLGNQHIRLALNCVGGEPATHMLRLLGPNAHLISYGAMAKQPISVPTSYFIFKNLKAHGFWQHRWYEDHTRSERVELLEKLVEITSNGRFKEPKHEIVVIGAKESDDDATRKIQQLLAEVEKGSLRKKILLHIEDPE